ncbi:MAG: hypothetical protein OXC08_14805 [Thiotrichales bacterium]|nr:hypothetical protein [Thiotrichales bacterium]
MNRGTLGITHGIIVMFLIIALVVVSSILLHVMFSLSLTDLAIELMAAALAVVLVVASVGVTIHFQSKAETERQYRVCLFENKMKEYTKFLEITAKSDDDDKIENTEIDGIRNQARVAAMLAERELVVCLADFVANLEKTRNLYTEDTERKGAFQQVIISMREDLGVVDETTGEAKQAIRRLVTNL